MATRKPDDPKHTKKLPGEAELSYAYRRGSRDMPPAVLDARILDAAHAAVRPAHPYTARWVVPLSSAAVVVLAVGVMLLLSKQGALNHRADLDVPDEYSAAPPVDRATNDMPQAPETDKEKRAAPEAVARLAESAEGKPATSAQRELSKKIEAPAAASAPIMAAKKAEAPLAAAAPPAMGRAVEADSRRDAREDKTQAQLSLAGAAAMNTANADVIAVQASGTPGAYEFNVTVKSPDTGCKQYADWWEVVSEDGKLLYRRVLFHSHVGEQPFTRDGGPVPIKADTVVWVRGHMNTGGYGGVALRGSVKTGFAKAEPPANFAVGLAKQPPLPDGCDF